MMITYRKNEREGCMKRLLIPVVFIIGFVFLIGLTPQSDMPGPDADKLWNYLTKVSPYKEWGQWADHSGLQPGRAPHGPFHQVFVNKVLLDATSVPVPYGSIQVKESFNRSKKMTAITVMYKVKDFNPNDGDWFWVKYSLEGKGGPAGKVKGCIGCHGGRAKNDFILVHDFK